MFRPLYERNIGFFLLQENNLWFTEGLWGRRLATIPHCQAPTCTSPLEQFPFLFHIQMVSLWESCECYLRAVLLVLDTTSLHW